MSKDLGINFFIRWHVLATDIGLHEIKSQEIGKYLQTQYSGRGRHYHNVRHILSMLSGFDELEAKFENSVSSKLAIFFHDVIYDVARTDSEIRSVAIMMEKLYGFVDDAVLASAAFSIEATKQHAITPDPDTNLIIDLDMMILGLQWDAYEQYARGVMLEYVPVYGEEAYREGRQKLFLEPLIARADVFLTDDFRHLNEQAIRNMQREADILRFGKNLA